MSEGTRNRPHFDPQWEKIHATSRGQHFNRYSLQTLALLDKNLAARQRLAITYREGIHNPGVKFPVIEGAAPTRVTVRVEQAAAVATELRRRGIPANTLYPSLDGMFRNHLPQPGVLTVSEHLQGRLLNLWTNEVSSKQVEETVSVLNRV